MTSVSYLILNLSYTNKIETDIKFNNVVIATHPTLYYLNIFHMFNANAGPISYLVVLIHWMTAAFIPLLCTYM